MADEDETSQLELIKRLGDRVAMLARLHTDSMKQLAERAVLAARMHAESMAQFSRSIELSQRIAGRLADRIQARRARA